jgi:hypothetical protein
MFCLARADVAQLVEQRFRKPQVTGSNPVVGSSLRSQQRGERKLSRRSLGGGGSFEQAIFVASYGLAGSPYRIADFGLQIVWYSMIER